MISFPYFVNNLALGLGHGHPTLEMLIQIKFIHSESEGAAVPPQSLIEYTNPSRAPLPEVPERLQ